mmetsp:Transcript_43697/g.105397  ORF Transcript_43697/g.105397 Transcript_43697/m.105397 type:complete len:216 (+) Transcript_43697:62-709(+)
MTKILLSCNADDYDNSQKIQAAIQEQLGFTVMMDVEGLQQENNEHDNEESSDEALDNNLEAAAVLLVFQFRDSNMSAWVMIEDNDERIPGFVRNDNVDDYFPDCVNFSTSIAAGMAAFEDILNHDLGLVVRPPYLNTTKKSSPTASSSSAEVLTAEVTVVAPLAQVHSVHLSNVKDTTATSSAMSTIPSADPSKLRLIGRVNGLLNKFKRRLSLQ